ncbi:DUF5050 domain-containing protein [Paenibacillus hexagrammi]|uniref:DUF5050 domain-containing protein n=1 Tax=Paenibacillus hexagrammi TaxID=2908839 RepID=A0ABY3SFY3_9BACL|nr:DUF5050 domain-containing protein [Paenibacillus sp. YPD9-1]UJF32368.1 DUF5050 domain-containing protein [Paenibacillus sp. YPD9-1]
MSKKWFTAFMVVSVCIGGCLTTAAPSYAAESEVSVTLPDFSVKLNGNEVENQNREYPLLVYKDITYVPMTWYDCRLLGLETKWDSTSGLSIAKGNVASSYVSYQSDKKNKNRFKAQIHSSQITINGKSVDNAKEEYPLLSYNNVAYFPLTWRFAHDEFGWEYQWSESEGLSIQSDNPQITSVPLPASVGDMGVARYKDYYYFAETEDGMNNIYRSPASDPTKKELVYSYAYSDSYSSNKRVSFLIKDNELWFSYHEGGAIMGHDVYGKISDDGKGTVEHQGYLDFASAPKGTLVVNQSVPPSGDNLRLAAAGQDRWNGTSMGDPKLIYGWHIGDGYTPDRSTTVIGTDAYVMGSADPNDPSSLNHIYRINLQTNKTTELTSFGVKTFTIIKDQLMYVKDSDHLLYTANLDGTGEQQLSDHPVSDWYDVIDGHIYYMSGYVFEPRQLYQADLSQEDAPVLLDQVIRTAEVNGKLVCQIAEGGQYGMKVLDAAGDLRLSITDGVAQFFTDGDSIVYESSSDHSVKWLKP